MAGPRPRTSELLYDAVALGMWTYVHAAFRVQALGGEGLRLWPGLMVVSTHRSDTDVPLICASIFFRAGMWRRHRWRLHFAARDDLFERGFFAGFPPGLPVALRRLLYPIRAGRGLELVRVHPIRSAMTLKLGQALAEVPSDMALEAILPPSLVDRLRERAAKVGLPPPGTAGEALRGQFADLLWEELGRRDLAGPLAEEVWSRQAAAATGDLRELVALVRAGEVLLLFPEGRPSPDGTIGPLRRGLGALVRRGRPETLLPLGVAYDPFTTGRTRVYLSYGEPFPPPADEVEEAVLGALRRVTPLTCGQVVAHRLVEAASAGREAVAPAEIDAVLAEAVEAARAEGRRADPALLEPSARRRRLSDCLATVVRLGVAAAADRRRLVLDGERVLAEGPLLRSAREYASARGEQVTFP